MSTTATTLITSALQTIGVLAQGETPSSAMANDGLQRLNWMLGQWALQPGTIPTRVRSVFAMVANQGGPTTPYTMGTWGDLNVARPLRLEGAAINLTASSPTTEVPLTLLTDDGYEQIQVKDLSNNQPTCVWYQPASPLGKVYLWPVPDNATNTLVLYYLSQLSTFADLTTAYDLPNGYEEALMYNLAKRLCLPYGRPVPGDVQQLAMSSLLIAKRPNDRFNDLPQDLFTGNRRYGYNINTGTGGGAS